MNNEYLKYKVREKALKKYKSLLDDYCIIFFRLDTNKPVCYFYYDKVEEDIGFFYAVSIQGKEEPLTPVILDCLGIKETVYQIRNVDVPGMKEPIYGLDLAWIYYACLIDEGFGIRGFKDKRDFFPINIELHWTNVMCAVTPRTKIVETVRRVEAMLNGKEK